MKKILFIMLVSFMTIGIRPVYAQETTNYDTNALIWIPMVCVSYSGHPLSGESKPTKMPGLNSINIKGFYNPFSQIVIIKGNGSPFSYKILSSDGSLMSSGESESGEEVQISANFSEELYLIIEISIDNFIYQGEFTN